jgi:hypothetical protein
LFFLPLFVFSTHEWEFENGSRFVLWRKGDINYLIQYKKVVVPGKDKNDLTSNDAMCHKWGYLVSKKIQTELNGE